MNWNEIGLVVMGALMGGAYVALFATAERWRREAARLSKALRAEQDSRDEADVTVVGL